MAAHTHDDGFREIQLSGKQLVFLFMAATVVSVVIFLCGVLVGRGVRSAQDVQSQAAVNVAEPVADNLPPASASAPVSMSGSNATPSATPGGSDSEVPGSASGQTPTGELRPDPPTPPRAAERKAESATTSKPAPVVSVPAAAVRPAAPPAATTKPAPVTAAASQKPAQPPTSAPVPAATTSSSTSGWVVQLAALNDRGEAEEIARRLVSKGYGAFVVSPASGNPSVYRVRVGTFKTRSEADEVGAKLKKEERFDPWITR